MVRSFLCIMCVILANFCVFGQITFSKDWRPSGKRSFNSLMSDGDYGNHLKSALGYTRLAEIHLQSMANTPRHVDRMGLSNVESGLAENYAYPYFPQITPPEDEKTH